MCVAPRRTGHNVSSECFASDFLSGRFRQLPRKARALSAWTTRHCRPKKLPVDVVSPQGQAWRDLTPPDAMRQLHPSGAVRWGVPSCVSSRPQPDSTLPASSVESAEKAPAHRVIVEEPSKVADFTNKAEGFDNPTQLPATEQERELWLKANRQ